MASLLPMTPDVKLFVICSAVLYLKFLISTMIQGRKGFHAATHVPEDSALFVATGMPKQQFYNSVESVPVNLKAAYESEQRWKRIVQNDLESMPMAFVIFIGAIVVGGNQTVTSTLLVLYTFARTAHTVVYAEQLQPHRMISWVSGVFCVVGATMNGVHAVLNA